jgi:hypothetical protein
MSAKRVLELTHVISCLGSRGRLVRNRHYDTILSATIRVPDGFIPLHLSCRFSRFIRCRRYIHRHDTLTFTTPRSPQSRPSHRIRGLCART